MTKIISATKKYAAPVLKRCFVQRYLSKPLRRMLRANAQKKAKADARARKKHPDIVDPETGKVLRRGGPLRSLAFKIADPTRATGALKRSERHPARRVKTPKGWRRRGDLPWTYVCR